LKAIGVPFRSHDALFGRGKSTAKFTPNLLVIGAGARFTDGRAHLVAVLPFLAMTAA
jgi:hypothetical protein